MTAATNNANVCDEFHRGMNFGFAAPRGWYGSEEALAQIDKMKALNINWVAAHITFVQETYASKRVFFDPEFTPGDKEVVTWVKAAHEAGLKVMLKPILEPLDGIWRGVVDPPKDGPSTFARLAPSFDNQSQWVKTFKAVLSHYIGLAAAAEADCLCLGAEYWKVEIYDFMWNEIITEARERYAGPVSYEFTPHGLRDRAMLPRRIGWWKKLDFLGFSAYGVNKTPEAPVEDFVDGLQERKREAAQLAADLDMPLMLLETGRRSTRGLAGSAADFGSEGVYDGDVQARYYEAVFQTFMDEPWFRGVYWWKWDEHQAERRPQYFTDPAGDQGFVIDGKPAADVLKRRYADLQREA